MRSLSKSQYSKGRKCLKRIWLYNFRNHLSAETSTFQESLFTQGNEVGELARQLYPSGILIDEDYQNPDKSITQTQAELQKGAEAIFEGTFLFENVAVRVDILVRNSDGSFDLIEVKSSTNLKKEHVPDCAIQAYVLQQSGIRLRRICVAYLNNQYVKSGDISLSELFIVEAISDASLEKELKLVPEYLSKIDAVLSEDEEPFWEIGSLCKSPYNCEFRDHCWKDISEKSIHHLSGILDKLRSKLISSGISLVKDIPESWVSERQKIQVVSEKTQEVFLDKQKISKHLKLLKYPLFFLDFETIAYAIPKFDGNRPYQKLPFQYSLHVQTAPDSSLNHYEFLFEKNENPMRALAERLVHDISHEGSIVVYNKAFEKGCLRELASEFLDLSPMLENMIDRLWDLLEPFSKKWFYDPRFNGSASIKKVLPVLAPDLSYKDLDIKQGDDAQAKYVSFINDSLSIVEREKIKNDLLVYCQLDSLAMVRILAELQNLSNKS